MVKNQCKIQINDNQHKNYNTQKLFKKSKNGIDIAFQNITYKVKVPLKKQKKIHLPFRKKYQQKFILKNINGIFKAGQVSVIMGASGAGKTTLLNILACRIHHQSEGRLYANKIEYNYKMFRDFANYVMQSDLLMETLTVRETLLFANNLKVKGTKTQKADRVDLLANQLKLQKCLDTLIGGYLIKGISGGQKKRVSIAFELISDPQVLFMDQPTSGLDSLTSYMIVSYLNRLAHKNNKTIIMTIHQPNTETYQMFDNLLLMVQGKIIYQGNAQAVTKYFVQNFNLKCPQFCNPPDFFMSKIHHQNQENKKRYSIYKDKYDQQIFPLIHKDITERQHTEIEMRMHQAKKVSIYRALIHRNILNTIRNPMLLKAKLFQGIFLSLFAGGIFFQAGQKDLTDPVQWQYLSGCLFFISINALTTSLSPYTLTFPLERPIFLKQQDSKMYTVIEYSVARIITDIPQLIAIPLINMTILYFMIGLGDTFTQYAIYILGYVLLSYAGASMGLLIGSAIQDPKVVSAVVSLILLPIILFSGYFKNRNDLPTWIGWLQYISPIKYGFIIFTQNQTQGKPSLINQLQFDLGLWQSVFILLALGMAYRLLSVFFLWWLRRKNQ